MFDRLKKNKNWTQQNETNLTLMFHTDLHESVYSCNTGIGKAIFIIPIQSICLDSSVVT